MGWRQRSLGEVGIAKMPAFQPGLQRAAQEAGKLKRGHVPPEWARSNRRERIAAALSPARSKGLLPLFPLDTEMTGTEMSLVPPLRELRAARPLKLLELLARGCRTGPVSEMESAGLVRLGLDRPGSLKERALRALVLGAMRR